MRAVSAVRPLLTALALLAATPVRAQPQVPGFPPDTQVAIDAERLTWEEGGVVRAEGNVRLSARTLRLGAERIVYDSEAGTVRLDGNVTAVDGEYVARAEGGFFDLATGAGTLEDVSLWDKSDALDAEPLFALSREQLGATGHNDLTVQAESVTREPDGAWVASRPTVTTCDCGDDPPSWTMGASSATVTTDDRLRLRWPVLYVRDVPVGAFPYFSLPLSDRKSGLLAPDVSLGGRRGFSWEQPLFLVLGRSYDATLTAGYFFGNVTDRKVRLPPTGTIGTGEFDRAFKGPRVGAEFRYVPRDGTAGRFFAAYANDFSYRPPVQGSIVPGTKPRDPAIDFPVDGRHRYFVRLDHVDDWPDGYGDRIALNLASDRFYLRDFTDEVVLRSNGVLTSSAWFAKREGPLLLALNGTYLQDLRLPFRNEDWNQDEDIAFGSGFLESSRLFGAGRRDTFARLPAFAADVSRLELPGGAGFSLHLGAARFAPLTSAGFGDDGTDGLGPGDARYRGPDANGTERNGRLDPGERPATTRLSLRPTLELPILAGPYLSLTPFAGWRQQLYVNDATEDGHFGYGVLGLDAHSELARTFSGGAVRHAWIPRFALRRLVPGGSEAAPERPYDELDMRPIDPFTQARMALGTRVDLARPSGGIAAFEAEVGQDFLLAPVARTSESFASAELSLSPARLNGLLRWDTRDLEITEVAAGAALTAKRGHQIRLGYRELADGGSARLLAGPDVLFAPATTQDRELASLLVDPVDIEHLQQISAGATFVPLDGLSVRYDLLFLFTKPSDRLVEQRAALGYRSGCDCWGGELRLALRPNEGVDLGVSVDLGGMVDF